MTKALYGKRINSKVMLRLFADVSDATSEITKNLDKPTSDNNETHIDTTADVKL